MSSISASVPRAVICTINTCSIKNAFVEYYPTFAGNITYLVIFAILLVIQLGLGIRYRTWGFMVGCLCGVVLEVIGYGGRIILNHDPFNFNGFLL